MKRILSSSNSSSLDFPLNTIAKLASTLSDIASAESDEQAIQVYRKALNGNVTSKRHAIKTVMDGLNFAVDTYKASL